MNKWIAEFELEDGDTMPEHMNLEYKGAKIDFHCRPKEPILDKIRALPPVTPTRKKGRWINKSHTSDCGIKFVASECTCCGKKTFFDCDELVYRFCPNCGAEMESKE